MFAPNDPIKTLSHLSVAEIRQLLDGVEYIIMAKPAVREGAYGSIHFTLFLNTDEAIPSHVVQMLLDKFGEQYEFDGVSDLLARPDTVAFARTQHLTPMPKHLFDPKEHAQHPHVTMFILDFEADSKAFPEATLEGLTGWSYVAE